MSFDRSLAFNKVVARHIDPRKFFGWLVGLMLPLTIVIQVFGRDPVSRGALFCVGSWITIAVVYFTAIRPAVRKAREEIAKDDRVIE